MNAIVNLSPDLSRRRFMGVSGVLVLGACLPTRKAVAQSGAATTFQPNLFLALDSDASVSNGRPRVSNAFVVLDCGTYANPDTCRAQMEDAVVFGLSLALHGDIAMKEGAVVQSNFHDYPMLRMPDAPATSVELVAAQGRLPAGVGEPGVPPVAPALSSALFAATGKRYRSLPIAA